MGSVFVRFIHAALWPVTVWFSLAKFKDHPADDYVGRTGPIMTLSLAFWACVAGLVFLYQTMQSRMVSVTSDGVDVHLVLKPSGWESFLGLALLFTPVFYGSGLWMFAKREERYRTPKSE